MNDNVFDFNKSFSEKQIEEEIKFLPKEVMDIAAKAFRCEKDKDFEGARQACREALAINSGKEVNIVKVLLSRVYIEILKDDIEGENEKYNQDINEYIEFIDTLTMNELMQEYIVDTMSQFCEFIESDWYRPLFVKFVDIVEKKNYLTEERFKKTTFSARISAESAAFYDDLKLTRIVKTYVKSSYMCEFAIPEEESKHAKDTMMLDNLTNYYYLCMYYPDNSLELDYLKEAYPNSYHMIEENLAKIEKDANEAKENTLDRLMMYVASGITKSQLTIAMENAYKSMLRDNNKPFVVHNGHGTYKRSYSKIGRNDLCPCGSGKKYKQCCGKNS